MKVELSLHLAGKALLDYELRFSEQAPETYAELIGYLGKKFTSQLDGITSIPAFTGRRMKPNESVNEYYADLVVKARCAFPGSSKDVLDSRIFETFVTNIGNEGLRVHLLSKDVKNIDQALNEALRFERIRGATLLEDRVNRVIGERENPQGTELHNWQGEPPQQNQSANHPSGRGITCYRCGGRGHIARTCTLLLGLGQTNRNAGQGGYANPTHGASKRPPFQRSQPPQQYQPRPHQGLSWQPQREQPPRTMPEFSYDRVREECLRDFTQEIENAYRRGFQEAAKAITQLGRQVKTAQGDYWDIQLAPPMYPILDAPDNEVRWYPNH